MKAALIGLGMVSGVYGDAFHNSNKVSLQTVYARSNDSRQKFLKEWPDLGAGAVDSIDAIASDPDIDFVILTTPPNARLDIVRALIEAGKPVLMEKPIERNLTNATALVELFEQNDVLLGIVLQHRARPILADLRRLVIELGELLAVEVNVPWWRPQSYYDEPGRGTYARDGGGVLISQAIHTLDLMLSITGPVQSVTAMTATTGFHKMEGEDFVCAGLGFANGAVGQLFATTASFPGRGETIRLHYRDGSIQLEAGLLQVDYADGRSETIGKAAASGAGANPMAFTSDWHRFVIEDFADALQRQGDVLVSGRAALEVHRLIAALEQSGRTGQNVSLKEG